LLDLQTQFEHLDGVTVKAVEQFAMQAQKNLGFKNQFIQKKVIEMASKTQKTASSRRMSLFNQSSSRSSIPSLFGLDKEMKDFEIYLTDL